MIPDSIQPLKRNNFADCFKRFYGISFKDFFAFGFDFTGFKGVAIDPQKVFDKDLSFANLNGVTIINTFDDVKYEGTNFEGMIYKTWEIRAKEYKKL